MIKVVGRGHAVLDCIGKIDGHSTEVAYEVLLHRSHRIDGADGLHLREVDPDPAVCTFEGSAIFSDGRVFISTRLERVVNNQTWVSPSHRHESWNFDLVEIVDRQFERTFDVIIRVAVEVDPDFHLIVSI